MKPDCISKNPSLLPGLQRSGQSLGVFTFSLFEANNWLSVPILRGLSLPVRSGDFMQSSVPSPSDSGLCEPAARMGSYNELEASSFSFCWQETNDTGRSWSNASRNPKCWG